MAPSALSQPAMVKKTPRDASSCKSTLDGGSQILHSSSTAALSSLSSFPVPEPACFPRLISGGSLAGNGSTVPGSVSLVACQVHGCLLVQVRSQLCSSSRRTRAARAAPLARRSATMLPWEPARCWQDRWVPSSTTTRGTRISRVTAAGTKVQCKSLWNHSRDEGTGVRQTLAKTNKRSSQISPVLYIQPAFLWLVTAKTSWPSLRLFYHHHHQSIPLPLFSLLRSSARLRHRRNCSPHPRLWLNDAGGVSDEV